MEGTWTGVGGGGDKHWLLSGLAINLPHLEKKHSGTRVEIPQPPAPRGASAQPGKQDDSCQMCWCFSGAEDKGALKLRRPLQNHI